MNFVWVFIGGGFGSIVRYAMSLLFLKWLPTTFPLSTLISNLFATAILGFSVYFLMNKYVDQTWISPLIIVGFCGGFSTFSTFSNETINLMNAGNYLLAISNIILSVVSGILILYLIQRMN